MFRFTECTFHFFARYRNVSEQFFAFSVDANCNLANGQERKRYFPPGGKREKEGRALNVQHGKNSGSFFFDAEDAYARCEAFHFLGSQAKTLQRVGITSLIEKTF
jgi:hypothetical protein